MRQVALFASFVLFIACVVLPGAHAQTPSPPRDSLLWAACMPVYVNEFKRQGRDEQKAPLMASLFCQIVVGACQRDPRGQGLDAVDDRRGRTSCALL